jgi:hypothetical protein
MWISVARLEISFYSAFQESENELMLVYLLNHFWIGFQISCYKHINLCQGHP